MPLILPGNVASATAAVGYDVANSCRFDAAGDAHMQKTFVSGNQDRWTFSCWVKNCGLGGQDANYVFSWFDDTSNLTQLNFEAPDHTLRFLNRVGASTKGNLITTRVFRDPAAWYHIVIVWDSGNATAGNRMRMYVNGVEETVFGTDANPDQNQDSIGNKTDAICIIGNKGEGIAGTHLDSYLAEVVFIDGTVYAASDFGEFDEDSPTIWKPKDISGLTFGTTGFYLDFEASDNLGNDANGGTDWTENNLAATDQSSDSPTNNFATGNPLQTNDLPTFSEGNLAYTTGSNAYFSGISTIGVSSGKWFMECNWVSGATVLNGVIDEQDLNAQLLTAPAAGVGFTTNSVGYFKDGTKFIADSNTSYGASLAAGDIIGIALDLDSGTKTVTFYKNGSSQGAINLPTGGTGTFFFASSVYAAVTHANYGNPPYANTSSVADANGYGAFEYAPPSGYFALCTKNLAEFG